MPITDFDPYQELVRHSELIEDIIRHTNRLIQTNNKLNDSVEWAMHECKVLNEECEKQQERITMLEDLLYDS